jgi:hypothetical protein
MSVTRTKVPSMSVTRTKMYQNDPFVVGFESRRFFFFIFRSFSRSRFSNAACVDLLRCVRILRCCCPRWRMKLVAHSTSALDPWAEKFLTYPSAVQAENHLSTLAQTVRVAGTPGDYESATWFLVYLLETRIHFPEPIPSIWNPPIKHRGGIRSAIVPRHAKNRSPQSHP